MPDTPKQTTPTKDELKLSPLHHDFNCNGETYVYEFNELSADRIFQAQRLFRIDNEILRNLPALPSEIQIATERQTLRHAFAALLMKKKSDGNYEVYNPASVSSYDALSEIKGSDFIKLMECQKDFFLNSGLSYEFSTNQSKSAMKDAVELMKGLNPEQLKSVIENIGSFTSLGKISDANSTLTDTINSQLENLPIGQSSGSPQTTTQSKGKKS